MYKVAQCQQDSLPSIIHDTFLDTSPYLEKQLCSVASPNNL